MDTTELRALLEEQLHLSRRLRARIRELEAGRHEPLAIVGLAMRFPGAVATPHEFADLIYGEDIAIGEIPADRPGLASAYHPEVGKPGRSYVARAGFLDDIAGFDADFFGISQREAESLDPQQRLLLETAWEALERAGIAVRRTDRLDAGVFIGIMASEYTERLAGGAPERLDPYYGTGGGHCFAAGRISYALGLRGPAVSIDTACSSSLVALHAAAGSLRSRQCRYALVGGANLLLSPHLMISLCQSRALAPDGRSKPFTAAADGYGRGEGVATVVLMRLEDAVHEGRPVLATLRGIAVNHDGASSGLTVPSGPAQQEVIRAAVDEAGVPPEQVSYVEAHGTGTALGDPIEAGALEAVYGPAHARAGTRLLVGSVKARLGHLEAAAGMASLIKVVLMLHRGEVPAEVPETGDPLSAMIPWHEYHLELPRTRRPWPEGARLAGVSAFGLSGTNAHAVLGAGPATDPPPVPGPRPELLVLSARTGDALRAHAAAVSTHLFRAGPAELSSVCHTLRAGRAAFTHRLAVVGTTVEQLAADLAQAAAGRAEPAKPPRRVVLATDPATHDALAAAVAALAGDLPMLVPEQPATPADPAAWLAAALTALGQPVRLRTASPGGGETLAWLEWGGPRVPLITAESGRATRVFLAALAELFLAGADLGLAPLRAPGARFLPNLPTYPFQRRRYWIDEPGSHYEPTASAESGPTTSTPDPDGGHGVEQFLRVELAAVLGSDQEVDLELSFAELGGDSFTAMLFFKSVEDRYQVPDLTDGFPVDQPLRQSINDLAVTITRHAGQRE